MEHGDSSYTVQYWKFVRSWGTTSKAPMWTVDINYVTQNNGYVQMLATLRVFLPLLRDLREMSIERFVKPAVICES